MNAETLSGNVNRMNRKESEAERERDRDSEEDGRGRCQSVRNRDSSAKRKAY